MIMVFAIIKNPRIPKNTITISRHLKYLILLFKISFAKILLQPFYRKKKIENPLTSNRKNIPFGWKRKEKMNNI
jgi:hypothetical protein